MFEHDPLVTLLLVLTAFQVVALAAAWLVLKRRPLALTAARTSIDTAVSRLAERPRSAITLVFLVAFALSALLATVHWPVPRIQDEFSYRLAGETFAAGRLTNPPHPMWPHFETEHVLQQPTYMSKYPPMQGLALAAGNVIAGTGRGPMLGAWLGLAAACAAVCWMFYAFLPTKWALLGGLLVASHPWLLAWWGHSAWGGQMAMLGGALLFGALRRIIAADDTPRPRAAHAVILGIGLAILANSRPYEGFIASLPAAALLAWRILGPRRPSPLDSLTRIVLPIAALLALTGAAMSMYNQRITGDPFKLPYQLHSETYGATPMFLWQDLPPEPDYRDRKLRDFHAGWERGLALDQRTPYTIARKLLHKTIQFAGFYLGPALGLATIGLCIAALRRRTIKAPHAAPNWERFAVLALGWTLAASLLCVWFNPHYVAPIAPLVLLLAVIGLRRLTEAGGRWSRLATTVIAAHTATAAALLIAAPLTYPNDDWSHARAKMIADLTATGEKHLVILRHGREYSPHEEWVYNGADIDAAPVVWARELDSDGSRSLREYYKDRRHWLLHAYRPEHPDGTPAPIPRLEPYPDLPTWLNAPPQRLLVGESIGPVLISDLDADGAPELIAAPIARAVLELYHAGELEPALTIPLPAPASALAALEPDAEGRRRVVAALTGRPSLVVITLATGDIPDVTQISLPAEARSVAIIPGESLLAVSCASPSGVAFIGLNGRSPTQPWLAVGSELHGIVAADPNADGIPDVAACDRTGNAVWLIPGRRDGGAWGVIEPVRIGEVPEAIGLAVISTNSIGSPSLTAASAARDSVILLTPAAGGGYTAAERPTGVVPLAIATVDVDADGLLDLAVATRWGHGLSILRNQGPAAGFAPPAEVTLGAQTWFVDKAARLAAGDLDGDGIADIAVAAADGIYVFLSSGR